MKTSAFFVLSLFTVAVGAENESSQSADRDLLITCEPTSIAPTENCLCNDDADKQITFKRCTDKEKTTWFMGTTDTSDDIVGRLSSVVRFSGTGTPDSSYCINIESGIPNTEQVCVNLYGCTQETAAYKRNICTCVMTVDGEACNSCSLCGSGTFSYDCSNIAPDFTDATCTESSISNIGDIIPTVAEKVSSTQEANNNNNNNTSAAQGLMAPVTASIMAIALAFAL